jgi:hypothetical protein
MRGQAFKLHTQTSSQRSRKTQSSVAPAENNIICSNQGAKSRQLLRICTQLQNLKITLATFLVLREKWTSVSRKLTNIPAGIYQGKQGSVTLSKDRKLIRPLSTWQNLRGMPSNLFSTVSSSSLEGGLSLHIKQTKSCDGRKSTYQSI